FLSFNSIGNRFPARKNPQYKVNRRFRANLGEDRAIFPHDDPFPAFRTPTNSHHHMSEFQCSKLKNSFRFEFPMSKNTRLQKISRFGALFEKSIFPLMAPQPWGLR